MALHAPIGNQQAATATAADQNAEASHTKNQQEPAPGSSAFKRILVAVDHENHPALSTALSLAAELHGQVAVIFVFEPSPVPYTEIGYLYATSIEEERAHGQEILKRIENQLPRHARAFVVMREGNAAHEIIRAADEWDADLIVVGTHRKGPIARALLGSTSESIIRKGHRPMLLVDVTDEFKPAQARAAT